MSQKNALKQIATLDDCVVVVIDVQNDFCAAEGALARQGCNLDSINRMLPILARFLDRVRQLGGKIIFTQHSYDPSQMSSTIVQRDRLLFGGSGFPTPGSWGEAFCAPVQPRANEPVIIKHRYNAFSNPEFAERLSEYQARTLLLTGVLTNVCVETTARATDAREYYPIVIEDCVASDSPELHRLALKNLQSYFAWVCSSAELMALWTNPD